MPKPANYRADLTRAELSVETLICTHRDAIPEYEYEQLQSALHTLGKLSTIEHDLRIDSMNADTLVGFRTHARS